MESVLIPSIVLTVPFIFVIVIEWIKSVEKRKRYDLQAELYAKALEKGQSISTDWFTEVKKKRNPRNPLNTGIILMSAGAGISLLFWLMSISFVRIDPDASVRIDTDASTALISVASVGVVPFLVGIGFLIIHFIEKKKTTNENAQ